MKHSPMFMRVLCLRKSSSVSGPLMLTVASGTYTHLYPARSMCILSSGSSACWSSGRRTTMSRKAISSPSFGQNREMLWCMDQMTWSANPTLLPLSLVGMGRPPVIPTSSSRNGSRRLRSESSDERMLSALSMTAMPQVLASRNALIAEFLPSLLSWRIRAISLCSFCRERTMSSVPSVLPLETTITSFTRKRPVR